MDRQEASHIVECPGCKWKLTVYTSSNFQGQIRILCNRCNKILTTPKVKAPKLEATLAKEIAIPPIPPAPAPSTEIFTRRITPQQIKSNQTMAAQEWDFLSPSAQNMPEKVGEYRLIKLIGSGAMGEIYQGSHVEKDNIVAIKLLSQKLQTDSGAVERFLQEAKVHSRLVHPNIVRIFDVGYCTNSGRLFLVMEYVEGDSLEKIMAGRGSISQRHSLKIAIAVAHALEHALEQRIIHRDLKPANIMIDKRTRKVKVADLGLGKILEEKGATLSGELMGTAYYMPPEQIHNAKSVDHRADIYALGATLYHMLAGRPPYSEFKGTLNILRAKITQDAIPIQEYVPNIHPSVVKVLDKAMNRDKNNRFKTPSSMIKKLQKALELIKAAGQK